MFRVLFIAFLLAMTAGPRADQLASYQAAGADILLMTERCGARNSRLQQAVKRSPGGDLDGCWAVNVRGNPVVMWGDGTVQELNESRVRLAPAYAAMLADIDEQQRADADTKADFPRPAWCRDAGFPHERLVCSDPELAAADLALAPLWQTYRTQLKLNLVQQARQKGDYFRRLKRCGAHKECIAREQATQTRFYRDALTRAHKAPDHP